MCTSPCTVTSGSPSPFTPEPLIARLLILLVFFLYCYTVGLLPILLAFSLYCWPSPYTVGLLPILLAFSLYCWPSPYTVGLLPILLAFSLYCWPSPYTVGLLPILLAFSLYCWPSPYTVGLLPILLAFSLYCWPSPYILLAFSLYCWLSPYTIGLLPILLALLSVDMVYCWPSPWVIQIRGKPGGGSGKSLPCPIPIHCIWTTTVYSVQTGTGLHIRWVWPKQLQQLEDITSHAHIPGCSQCYCSECCDCTVQSKRPADPV